MKQDLSKCMFELDKNKTAEQSASATEYYTILGDQDFLDENGSPRTSIESNKTFAKKQRGKFYVKLGSYNRMLNPMGLFSEGTENKFLSKIGRQEWIFREVKESTFQLYVKFLSTKNIAWLQNAEREMI